jgi:hypothetical protein
MAKLADTQRNACANAVVDAIDGGAGPGTLEVFTGAAPTNTTDADSGTKLATATFADPAYGNAAAGVATNNAITGDSSVDATGTPGHYRIKDSAAVVIWQGTAGAAQELAITGLVGGQMIAGGTFSVSTLTWTQPAGT